MIIIIIIIIDTIRQHVLRCPSFSLVLCGHIQVHYLVLRLKRRLRDRWQLSRLRHWQLTPRD